MEKTLIIHGRQAALGVAELESIYGSAKVKPVGGIGSLLDIEPIQVNFARFGGMVKFCKVLLSLDTIDWSKISEFLSQIALEQSKHLDEGRLTLGVSVYGIRTNTKSVNGTGLRLKKSIKATGRSVRVVPNKDLALNTAQVLHNNLTQKLGRELVLVRDGNKTIIAQTIAVQDIEKYAARDQGRPLRDAKVGMLPPKLAQTIINLATKDDSQIRKIYDPFCGSGVILQEALLMGYGAIGSDIDPRMADYSKKNLDWLITQGEKIHPGGIKPGRIYSVTSADATKTKLPEANAIASEIFLGKPLTSLPDTGILNRIVQECDKILETFLMNIAAQTNASFRMCLAVPAWKEKNGFKHLNTLDKLSDLGYNRVKFVHTNDEELIYHRPDQVVARELLVLERK